jgi:3-isopropylmalate dehydrogenase
LDLYAGIRPIKLYPKVRSPLILKENQTIDYVVVRENTEGLYASRNGGIIQREQVAVDLSVFTREGVERIVRAAFRLAERRMNGPQGRVPMVTCVDKSNVTPGYAFFRKVFREVAEYWPHVEKDCAYIDAFTVYQVTMPECYDVVVAENMFGDIISDLGAATVGGLGMAPSADVGDRHGLFQPAHGSAPPLAGKNIANPLAAILSAGMMVQWLGERVGNEAVCRAAERIDRAVSNVLIKNEIRTQDIGGSSKTTEVGDAVADRIVNM